MQNSIRFFKPLLKKLSYGIALFITATIVIFGAALIIGHLAISHLTLNEIIQHTAEITNISKLFIYFQLVIGSLIFLFWHQIFEFSFKKEWVSRIEKQKLILLRWNYFAVFLCVMVVILMGLNQ